MRDPHGRIFRKVQSQPVRYLFGTPGACPMAILTGPVASSRPDTLRPCTTTRLCPDRPREAILNVLTQACIGHKLGHLRTPAAAMRMPLSCDCAVLYISTASSRVAPQF